MRFPLNIEDIQKLANWEPVEARDPKVFLEALRENLLKEYGPESIEIKTLEDSVTGLSSYDCFFVVPYEKRYGNTEGVMIYVSDKIPVVAVGRMRGYFSPSGSSFSGLEPSAIESNISGQTGLMRSVIAFVQNSSYHLLSQQEALAALPQGISPQEYCPGNEPWDRVFHLLYSNTD